jgi:hypothetical protein
MARLTTDRMVRADPSLATIFPLSKNVDWMNGIQFYLGEDAPIGPGHQIYLDSPWALTSISQHQFWPDVDLSRYADGQIRGILSVVISDWDTPGLNGKPARACSREEVRDEVWDQLKRSLNVQGAQVLQDEDRRHWYLDASIDPVMGANAEPLLVNLIDTWRLRPTVTTAIPNLLLAADYVQTSTDLACMEGANEAARRAVNAIVRHAGVDAPLCRLWDLHEPVLLEPVRAYDRLRFRQGLPWDDMRIRFALSALSALQRGTLALQELIRESIGAQSHVEDVLSYLSTGESRSVLVDRLTSSREPSAELLRAFAELTRSAVTATSDTASTPAVQALTSAVENLSPANVPTVPPANVRFVEP